MTADIRSAAILPGWRRPFGAVTWHPPVNSRGLREAVYELLGSEPQTLEEIAIAVREEWGEASGAEVGRAIGTLRRDGSIERLGDGYVRRRDDA